MASLNQCNFIGNVGRDPEVRYSQDGKAVANFSIAVTEKWKDNEKTEWVRVVAFSKLAEIIGQYVKKGSPIFITGRMQSRSYEKDGITRYTTEIVADKMQLLGGKSGNHDQGQDNAPDDGSIPF